MRNSDRLGVMKPFRLRLARIITRQLPPFIAAHVSQRIYSCDRGWKDNYDFLVRSRTGSPFAGTTRDMHACVFAIHGYYDWRVLATAAYLCGPADCVVEVGANVGTETVGLADIVGPRGRVFAFEPDPTNVQWLRGAVKSAALNHVEVIAAAVSDEVGTVRFFKSPDERESGSGSIHGGGEFGDTGGVDVDCVTLDGYLRENDAVRLVLIDVEGSEVRVLRGSRSVLARERPAIIVEAQEMTQRRAGFSLRELHSELVAQGYEVHAISRFGLCKPRIENYERICNWLALPPALVASASGIRRHLRLCATAPCIRWINPLTKRYD